MNSSTFIPVYGIILTVQQMTNDCCQLMVSIQTNNGIVNMVVSPETYVIQNVRLRPGMTVAAFYDANVPVPLIFPPQYRAVAIGRRVRDERIVFDYFNGELVGSNQSLKLNPGPNTEIITSNGQPFFCDIANRYLIVYYRTETRSIPPQTTPSRIIVMC